MSNLSVPLPTQLDDDAVLAALQAEQEIREGKIVRGELRQILKKSTT